MDLLTVFNLSSFSRPLQLKYINWRVDETERGYCRTILPLNVESTNQHITHQAAVIMIAADYTGGIALGTILNNVPVVGIHPQETEYGAYLWAGKAEVKWLKPSCDDLVCTARIDNSKFSTILSRFARGSVVLSEVLIEMHSGNELIAEATITYWVQDTFALKKNAFNEERIHPLYRHKLRTAENLISGLKLMEQEKPADQRLFDDEYVSSFTNVHGKTLATRFKILLPQIQPLVAARVKHIDRFLKELKSGFEYQIVLIGVGLDTRPFRTKGDSSFVFFELDLPVSLSRREKLISDAQLSSQASRVSIPFDLSSNTLKEVLMQSAQFDESKPTVFVWEGGTMYFGNDKVMQVLGDVASLMQNPNSLLWIDYVLPSSELLIDSDKNDVDDYLGRMRTLGVPIINHISDFGKMANECGLEIVIDNSASIFSEKSDCILDLFRFAVLKPLA